MKRKQKIIALLVAICLLVPMIPLTGMAAGEVKSRTLQVLCEGQVVDGATITVELRSSNGESVLLGTSSSGELTVSTDLSDVEGKTVEVTIVLPEGYEVPALPSEQKVLQTGYEPESFFDNGTGSWNVVHTEESERLLLAYGYMEINVGNRVDISGAFQSSFTAGSGTNLYFCAKDGTKTLVACDRMEEESNPVYTKDSENSNLLIMARAGTSKIIFYYGEYSATLTLVVKDASIIDSPEINDELRDVFRYSVLHNGEVVGNAIIRILLENDDGANIVWAASDTGEIEFSRSNGDLKNYQSLGIEVNLPEGYQCLYFPTSLQSKFTIWYDMSYILSDDAYFYNEFCEVVNPAVDGTLEIPETYIEAKIGDVIDLSGAFELDAEAFPLYFLAPDGTRTRVVCDNMVGYSDEDVYRKDGYKLTIVDYGMTQVAFYYANTVAVLEIYVPSPEDPSDIIQISDNEFIYIYPDGTENRVILAEDDIYFATVEGNKDYIPTGCRFENKPVTEGEIFNKAKDAIQRNFNTESLRVFEMNLWDAAGNAIHQLPGMVEVGMALPEGFQPADGKLLMVYRLEDNGNLTRCNTSLVNGWITFRTDHFSTYILAEVDKNAVEPTKNINTAPVVKAPKTGEAMSLAVPGLVLAFGALVLVNRKKRV